ncbi:MAG: BMP family ABC transporter substrate-binding protein [Eubacterium sp.]|nr:BMP family ABC transporter substrate-binding protein [Eubacterium sp.]
MNIDTYDRARKLGIKSYKARVAQGQYPYLPVLDDIINKDDLSGDVNLGLVDIPLDRVVGTSTAGRTQAFAENFMPLMESNTEFGNKWALLSEAHLTDGIRDPIKVYEYLNYYYVVEGNKRVSVLKYFEADSIPAFVTRKVPKLTDDEEIKIYYEFMDFDRKTGVNFIWFSHTGGYKQLIEEVNKAPKHGGYHDGTTEIYTSASVADSADGAGIVLRAGDSKIWSEDTILEVKAAYRRFAKAYKQKGGDHLKDITTGDAFLAFIGVEGFDNVCEMNQDRILSGITAMWQEFLVINEQYKVEVSLDPPEQKKNVLSSILTPNYSAAKPLKIAFIYDRDPAQSNWLYAHELGRNHLKEVYGDKVNILKITTTSTEEDALAAMEDMIESQGVEVIFTPSTRLVDASLKCAIKYPDVKVLNCSINTSHRYIRTYYARLYEAKFLSGMVAGALTETDKIAYLADYPIFGITANINAFALGARMVNPRVKVYLKWTTLKDSGHSADLYKSLYEDGIDYVSDQDMITPKKASRNFGMYKLTGGEPINQTMTVSNWGILYEKIIDIIMQGNWGSTDSEKSSTPINYWWGLSAGVVDIILSERIPSGIRRLVETIRDLMIKDEFASFTGEIFSQDGRRRCEDGKGLGIEDIIKMDWLLDNVIGEIPDIDKLKDRAKSIVEIKGVMTTDGNGDKD